MQDQHRKKHASETAIITPNTPPTLSSSAPVIATSNEPTVPSPNAVHLPAAKLPSTPKAELYQASPPYQKPESTLEAAPPAPPLPPSEPDLMLTPPITSAKTNPNTSFPLTSPVALKQSLCYTLRNTKKPNILGRISLTADRIVKGVMSPNFCTKMSTKMLGNGLRQLPAYSASLIPLKLHLRNTKSRSLTLPRMTCSAYSLGSPREWVLRTSRIIQRAMPVLCPLARHLKIT